MRFIERFILLRSLNYVRIRHRYWRLYNLSLPLVLSGSLVALLYALADDIDVFGEDGVLRQFSQILSILAPFYIAALAAVATFAAGPRFDQPLKMIQPPVITLLHKGEWLETRVTLRHFLSMLFGYCAIMSFSLFFISIFLPLIATGLIRVLGSSQFLAWLILCVFLFMLFHMLTATLLGMYYLSDRMHRE